MAGNKVTASMSVAAQSHVHAVLKAVPQQLKSGRSPGKPWFRVVEVASGKASEFQLVEA